jgi:hypothetical protein
MFGWSQGRRTPQRDGYQSPGYWLRPGLREHQSLRGFRNQQLPRHGHENGHGHSRTRPNDIEEATRAHVKVSKEYDNAKREHQDCMQKYDEATKKMNEVKQKVDEATARLKAAKRRAAI